MFKNIFIVFPFSILYGISHSILLIGYNIKNTFSPIELQRYIKRKAKKEKVHLTKKHLKFLKILFLPAFIIGSLIATIIMIPINTFLCAQDYIKEKWVN